MFQNLSTKSCAILLFVLIGFCSYALARRLPLNRFERIATTTDPSDTKRPQDRIPKKSVDIPEFKDIEAAEKKNWDDIASRARRAFKESIGLKKEELKARNEEKAFPREKVERGDALWREYYRLLDESEKLFEELLGSESDLEIEKSEVSRKTYWQSLKNSVSDLFS